MEPISNTAGAPVALTPAEQAASRDQKQKRAYGAIISLVVLSVGGLALYRVVKPHPRLKLILAWGVGIASFLFVFWVAYLAGAFNFRQYPQATAKKATTV